MKDVKTSTILNITMVMVIIFTCIVLFNACTAIYDYKLNATVIDSNEQLTVLKDENGNLWILGDKQMEINKNVTILMRDNGTERVEDDVIVDVR